MTIHTHLLGDHIKVQSHNAVHPAQRAQASPPALVLICHGVHDPAHAVMLATPPGLQVRFAVPHGSSDTSTDIKFFRNLIDLGLDSALQYDFKHLPVDGMVQDYALGKSAPDPDKGDTPAAMMALDKDARPPYQRSVNQRMLGEVDVVSAAYVDNLQLFAASRKKTDTFDFASIRSGTRSLKDVFDCWVQTRPRYDHLLCHFCRESL